MAQVQNMNMDEKETNYIHKVIKALTKEVEQLHKENNVIIKQNEQIIDMLRGVRF